MNSQVPNTTANSNNSNSTQSVKRSVRQKTSKSTTNADKFIPTHYFKAYLDKSSNVKVDFSRKPATPAEFTCLFMGVIEAYTELLLISNSKEDVYEHFNSAFGIFLRKIIPDDKIYSLSPVHKERKEIMESTLGQPEDPYANDTNRLAAYVLAKEILMQEIGLSDESADLILNKRLDLLKEVKPIQTKQRKGK